jgi:predicted methyltransferase
MILPSRRPLLLAFATVFALAACNEAAPPAPAPVAPQPAPEAAAPPPPAPTPAPAADTAYAADPVLDAAIAGPARGEQNKARDIWRHPRETLGFFGVQPTQTIVEVTPGGGWYTEILAPYLRDQGHYVGVIFDPAKESNEGSRNYYTKSNEDLRAKLAGNPAAFDKVVLVEFDGNAPVLGEPGSADTVLTFRNVHNWMSVGRTQAMFDAFYAVLKPGGTLGVVEHRAGADVPEGDKTGYVSENQVMTFAKNAGFEFVGKSEINANPKDTKDHPNGVWTLPPTLNVPEGQDAQKYKDIGESDRMTLKFAKPAAAPAAEPQQ